MLTEYIQLINIETILLIEYILLIFIKRIYLLININKIYSVNRY